MPFEELPHTADWCLRVWAVDLASLFLESARGMYTLSGAQPADAPTTHRRLQLLAPDPESLLVAFLSELIYIAEQERLVYPAIPSLELTYSTGWELKAVLDGVPLLSINKAIKAVTYHNLQIRHTVHGLEVEIVFDV